MENNTKQCARCNHDFECKPMDIENCMCSSVQLNENELQFLQLTYNDCLCIDCLQAIKQQNEH
jgi:hypothetical protein